MTALIILLLNLGASLFKPKSWLEAENAALRQQLTVLQRKARGRVQFTNSDRLFFIQLYRWTPRSTRDPARGPHRICARPRRPPSPLLPNLVFSTHTPPFCEYPRHADAPGYRLGPIKICIACTFALLTFNPSICASKPVLLSAATSVSAAGLKAASWPRWIWMDTFE